MSLSVETILDQLDKSESRRHKRFEFDRCVYAYRMNGCSKISDNLLLLPKESEKAHPNYLRAKYGMVGSDTLSAFKDLSLVLIGHFNVQTLKFTRCHEKVVLLFNEVINDLRKVEKK